MAADPAALRAILESFGRQPGRSAYAVIETPDWSWSGGVDPDAPRPAASLLKLSIGMAIEPHLDALAPQRVADLVHTGDVSALHSLDAGRDLSPRELHALMLSASDAPCARWAVECIGLEAIRQAVMQAGADRTEVVPDGEFGVLGSTTARDAVALVRAASDASRFPACARALRHSISNSRIPLGATADDVDVLHKTGTLLGVANDVAQLDCGTGQVWLAFLSEAQHDTLATGYDMGMRTRELLECAGMQVIGTRSFSHQP